MAPRDIEVTLKFEQDNSQDNQKLKRMNGAPVVLPFWDAMTVPEVDSTPDCPEHWLEVVPTRTDMTLPI